MKKYKIRTRKSISTRFKITKTGKVLRGSSFVRHLNSKKTSARLRRLNKTKRVLPGLSIKIKRILGI